MNVDFSEYINCFNVTDHQYRVVLDASYAEAIRIMSPNGLNNYLEGMRAMCTLGRGQDLVITFVQEIPAVVKEVGEDIIPEIVTDLMHLSSHTSGSVITLMLSNMPMVAHRLGDAELLHAYLKLLQQIAGKAPRGLRPMLEKMEELIGKLTLGGLRRWAMWGVHAYQRDLDGQVAYFGLQTDTARSVLQNERRGTLFVDNHRKLNFYLRALWARSFFIRPTSGDFENRQGIRPYIEEFQIYLPDAFDKFNGISGIQCYRASVAHCASHLVHTSEVLNVKQLSPVQMKFIEVFEDARVEYLAIKEFPGLKKLWSSFFQAELVIDASKVNKHPSINLILRMSYALLDNHYSDSDDSINTLANDFHLKLANNAQSSQISWDAGMAFYNQLSQHTSLPSLRILEDTPVIYRDDNRYIWAFAENEWRQYDESIVATRQPQVRKNVNVIEMVNTLDCELAGDDAQEIWTLETPFYLDQEDCTINDLEANGVIPDPYHYKEWDYHVQLYRPDWTSVLEQRLVKGDAKVMDDMLEKHKPIASRIKHLIDHLQPQGIIRKRGFEEGEELDLNAAVSAFIDIRRGVMPDPRINIRISRHIRDFAVLVLLDISESTNERIIKEDLDSPTILQLTREATALLSWAIDSIGDSFAVHGFASDGRHDVQYYRFKDFIQSYDENAKSRLAGMKGGLSTRMGSALRHAGYLLGHQSADKRLILLITDGEPADIDERDPQYLRHDTKKAVEELATQGIFSFCLTLDPLADPYVSRIFGHNNYAIVDNVNKLPERLPAVFAALTDRH